MPAAPTIRTFIEGVSVVIWQRSRIVASVRQANARYDPSVTPQASAQPRPSSVAPRGLYSQPIHPSYPVQRDRPDGI
ncbi:MAG: hypothetical protein AAFO62_01250, partial [Pseudomonadota bacterium]